MNEAYNPLQGLNSGDQSFGARLPYLLDGDFNLEIDRVAIRGRSKPNYIVEVKVLESNVPDRPPGIGCAIFIDINNADTRGKHLCAFIASTYGVDPMTLPKDSQSTPWDNQPWSGYAMWAASEQNPFAKKRIFCNVQTILKQNGEPWTMHTFSPYGSKPIGPRIFGPGYGQQQAPQQAPQNGFAPAGAHPGAAPGAAPGFAPPGFQAPAPQPGVPQQGFAAPMPPQGAPVGAPLAGWGPPAAPVPQAPQYQQPPQQPQYAQPPQQPQYAPNPAQPYPPQQPQQPQYPAQPNPPGFGGPWGGNGGPAR